MSARLPEGRLACPGARFAIIRRHASHLLSSSVCRPVSGRPCRGGVYLGADSAAPCSAHLVTAIRKYRFARAPRTTTPYEQAFAARAKLVVDAGMSFSLTRDCWRACFPARKGDSRSYGTMPPLCCPCCAAPPLSVVGIQDEAPSAGPCGRTAWFAPSQRYASSGPQMRSGQQLHTNKRLPPGPNSSSM